MIAVGESTAMAGEDEGPSSASTTLLRVGDTKVGESAPGFSNPLADALNGQPTEALIDGGCDNTFGDDGGAPLCVYALETFTSTGDGESEAHFRGLGVGVGNTGIAILNSDAVQDRCDSQALGSLVSIYPDVHENETEDVDPSEAFHENPECNIG